MQQLMFEEAGRYAWREAADPEISDGQAGAGAAADGGLLRPGRRRRRRACCRCRPDTPSATRASRRSSPSAKRSRRCGSATASSCRFRSTADECSACRRGVTGSCASLPLMAMYGMAPLAGLDGGGFMSDLVLVPFADAMLLPVPDGRRPGGDRLAVGQHPRRVARGRPVPGGIGRPRRGRSSRARGRSAVDRLVRGGIRSGIRRAGRLRRHRRAAARHGGEARRACPRPAEAGQVVGPVSGHGAHVGGPVGARRRRCARRGRTACAPTPASTTRARWRCRCCRCTPAVCAS